MNNRIKQMNNQTRKAVFYFTWSVLLELFWIGEVIYFLMLDDAVRTLFCYSNIVAKSLILCIPEQNAILYQNVQNISGEFAPAKAEKTRCFFAFTNKKTPPIKAILTLYV